MDPALLSYAELEAEVRRLRETLRTEVTMDAPEGGRVR